MSEDTFGPDFYTVEDEDGNQFELELIDSLEHNGILYHAFFPALPEDEDEIGEIDEEEVGLVLLKVVSENGEDILSSLDSEEEEEEIYDLFMVRFEEASQDED